ncbi:hypothetical protein [Apilactobacillus apinorum]|uniref:Uncharacterized protein n=1 Tax=Apilactobacillus apinorum TaxID=1218495 RepID=A0ABP9ZHN4_9LACO
MVQKVTNNHNENLIKEIDMLIDSLDKSTFDGHEAFKNQVKQMKKCFEFNELSIICFTPTLLECLNLNGKYFPHLKKGNSIINKKYFQRISQNLPLTKEAILYIICSRLYNSKKSEEYDFVKDGLNRHMVEHGFLSPNKISIKEFAQLIMICNGFANI